MGQLAAILWKNLWVYRVKRHYIVTFLEVALHLVLLAMLLFIRVFGVSGGHGGTARDNVTVFSEFKPNVSVILPPPVYAPTGTYASALVDMVFGPGARGFPTVDALNQFLERENPGGRDGIQLVVVFGDPPSDGSVPRDLRYTLRFNSLLYDFNTNTHADVMNDNARPRNESLDPYRLVVWGLQDKMFTNHIKLLKKSRAREVPEVMLRRFPYQYDGGREGIAIVDCLAAIFIVYGSLIFCPVFVGRLIREKTCRMRELMRMMGLKDWVYWLGSFISGFLFLGPILVTFAAVLKVEVKTHAAVIYYGDFYLLETILLLYCTAALLFLMVFTVLFNNPVMGVVFAVIGWITSYALPVHLLDPTFSDDVYFSTGAAAKLITSLLPNAGLCWCFRIVGLLETQGTGASWSNMWSQAVPADNVKLGEVMLVMLASVFFYALLLWYLDNVWPFQYGVPKHPLFFLQRSYWLPGAEALEREIWTVEEVKPEDEFLEQPPAGAQVTVSLSNVTKHFPGATTNAVDNLSLNMYEGQITALLGHNSAGKTTIMNMITGIYPPTRGQIRIGGHSVLTSTRQARRGLGLCPQHNVLFDEMTVEEHLYFFFSLKKNISHPWKEEVEDVLKKLDLLGKRHTLACKLSGGMMRKLSLGIAMIGDSKLLVLDEPTAGMDLEARRRVWTVLQEKRKTCTILLTTHHMEEADVLGDRIAFLTKGRLRCCGSPTFLKRKFGTGYRTRIAKADGCDAQSLTRAIEEKIPSSQLESDVGRELVYNLGFPPVGDMVSLFKDLESNRDDHGIASFGVSVTTMEDVFIRIGELSNLESLNDPEDTSSGEAAGVRLSFSDPSSGWQSYERTSGVKLLLQRTRGLILKRWHAARRSYVLLLFMLLIPLVIMTLYCIVDEESDGDPTRAITYNVAKEFGPSVGFLATDYGRLQDFATEFYKPAMEAERVDVKDVSGYPTGFLLSVAHRSVSDYKKHYLLGGQTVGDRVVAWYNGEPFHLGAMSLNLAHTAVLRYVTGDATARVQVTNAPLPGEVATDSEFLTRLLVAVFVPTALSSLSSSFVVFPAGERARRAKLLQLMTGVSPLLFWISSFVWDLLVHAMCCAILMLPILAINPSGVFLSDAHVAGPVYLLLLAYGWASIPISYLFSFLGKKPSACYALLITLNVLFGVIPALVMPVLSSVAAFPTLGLDAEAIAKSLLFLRLIPSFALAWGFANLHMIGSDPAVCASLLEGHKNSLCAGLGNWRLEACCQPCSADTNATFCYARRPLLAWDTRTAVPDVILMLLVGLVLFAILIICETWLGSLRQVFVSKILSRWRNRKGKQSHCVEFGLGALAHVFEDDDVVAERRFIEDLHRDNRTQDEALVVLDLKKDFGSLVAVDNLTFRVHDKECFGLLGVNGAGKTTTFRMLTGDLSSTSGNAFLGPANLNQKLKKFQSAVGYCPQFDALIDKLSGREMLMLFALLRGIPAGSVELAVQHMIDLCDLQHHADKPTQTYSGGTRRKLSIGMALIGCPNVVFLDEPTTGVDPAARRHIWRTLQEVQKVTGAAIVLTSQSMEECEALCQRLTIMVNGTLRCLGSAQQLKTKFGQGFTVLIKLQQVGDLSTTADADNPGGMVSTLCTRMEEEFQGRWQLKDCYQCLLHFHITDTALEWSHLFERMEVLKHDLGFDDYFLSDTTLEQIFLAFGRTQRGYDAGIFTG